MSNQIERGLQQQAIWACDKLYNSRQLITKNAVKYIVAQYGDWSNEELELNVPKYINEWRLKNLADDNDFGGHDRVKELEEQLSAYRSSLRTAQKTIFVLKGELRDMRTSIINELRSLLQAAK